MGIPKRVIGIALIALTTHAHSYTCNSTQDFCNEHQHWVGIAKEKPHVPAKIHGHTQSWFLAAFKKIQFHFLLETQIETIKQHPLKKEAFIKLETQRKDASIIIGDFTHPLQVLKYPIFSAYNYNIEENFQSPSGKGFWFSFDNLTTSLIEISATSNHTFGVRYSYDTNYLNSTRFSASHIYSQKNRYYSASIFSPGQQGSFFLIELTRIEEKPLPFKQIIKISYKEPYENNYRKFIQYDDILNKERRLIYGVDFDISQTKNDLHFTVFQEYRNPKNTAWFWGIHAGIGGMI